MHRRKRKKDILFLCQFFYPEVNSSATLPFDTACYLAQHGYTVDALCGYPKEYNTTGSVPHKECVGGVEIHRMRYLQVARMKRLGRLINYFSFLLSALFHIFKLRHYQCVIVYSNPPVLPLVAAIGNMLFRTKIIFVAYDVYPEIAIATKSLSPKSLITRTMNSVNAKLFKRAALVIALSEEMRSFLISHRNIAAENVIVIPNWSHEEQAQAKVTDVKPIHKAKKFIVTYLGNMGICQDMTTLLETAKALSGCHEIEFWLVGHGCKMNSIMEYVETEKLKNVHISSFLTGEPLDQMLRDSSAFFVSLENGLSAFCSPSKYSTYLHAGKPIISAMEKTAHISEEVTEKNVGFAIDKGNAEGLTEAILFLAKNPETVNTMSNNAKSLYDKKYNKSHCLDQYATAVKSLTGTPVV